MNRIFALILLIFTILNGNCTDAPDQLTENKFREIPLQGNSYSTAGNQDVIHAGSGALIHKNWTSTDIVISTYFRLSKDGDLQLSLQYTSDSDSKIRVSCQGANFDTKCPRGTNKTVSIGNIKQVQAGYIRVDFQGINKKGLSFPNIQSLRIEGKAAEEPLYFVNKSDYYYWGRRGPSVHLNYTLPEGNVEWFYNEVTVPEGNDPEGSYFMANGFSEGYFGMQVNSKTERRILFSVWSPYVTDNPTEIPKDELILLNKKGDMVTSQAFGGEGSGRQNFMLYPWKAGLTYKFLLHCRPDPSKSNYTEYTAYFHSPDNGWMLVASNSRPKISTYCTRPHSFLENFDPKIGYITRKVYFDNQWAYVVGKGWQEITQSKFTFDNTAKNKQRMDYKGGVENNRFFLQNCGFFNENTESQSIHNRITKGVPPSIDWEHLP